MSLLVWLNEYNGVEGGGGGGGLVFNQGPNVLEANCLKILGGLTSIFKSINLTKLLSIVTTN